jgi:hypothetical protein
MKLLAIALLLPACTEHGQTPTQTAIVSPLRTPCEGFGPVMCLTMVPDQRPQERLFFGIQGYEHKWGVESEITFRREVVEEPVPDGPGENIVLIETIVENQTITGPFDLTFPSGFGGWFSGTAPTLNMLGTPVQCETTVCNDILAPSGSGSPFAVTFEIVDEQTLRATAVTL